ncbi:MAG: hypothetical protein LC790_07720, partial [Actinobacteria bacterium]|nr:hypothetical protein [Actinomycetota bacterium]
ASPAMLPTIARALVGPATTPMAGVAVKAAADQSAALTPTTGSSTRQALPFTGLDIHILTLIGLLMLLAGAALRITATRPTRREKS